MPEMETVRTGRGLGPWRTVGGLVGLVAILALMTVAQSNFQEEDAEANQVLSGGAFGYADPEGRRVLTPVDTGLARGMRRFSKVVVAPGQVTDVTFVEVRGPAEDPGTRQSPETFDATSGAVFSSGVALPGGGDVLVATDRFLSERQVLPLTPAAHKECDAAVKQALEGRGGRSVAWCENLSRVGEDGMLSLARFAPRGREELFTLVYTGAGGPVFRDHPVEAGPGGTWHPDEGESFSAEGYQPLFAFRTKNGLEVAVRWHGADGRTMDLYRQEGETFVPYLAANWYQQGE